METEGGEGGVRLREKGGKERGERWRRRRKNKSKLDYSRLIEGYDYMTRAERVKAKMKLQLAETAEKDETKDSEWERFDFDKDAPLDDEEIEEDDATLVNHIGQSFRFSAIEKGGKIKAAHGEGMFGASAVLPSASSDSEAEPDNSEKKSNDSDLATSLFSKTVLAKQQVSQRDPARRV